MILDKLASAIRNDVVGGLRGYHTNMSMSLDQIKDDIIDMCAYAQDMLLKHPSSIALSTEYDVMGELLNSGQLIEGNIYS